jgi:hypothetical protein
MTLKKWFGPGCIAVLLAVVLGGCSKAADWNAVHVPEGTFVTTAGDRSEQQYKDDCQYVDYRDFFTDPEAHKGEDVYFKGHVTVAHPATDSDIVREVYAVPLGGLWAMALGLGSLGPGSPEYDTAVVILWPGPLDVFDGRMVEVWGECQGAYENFPIVLGRYLTMH